MSISDFRIGASPFADRGYDVTGGEVLELQLEAQPATDVLSCAFSVEASTSGAPAMSFTNSGIASPPSGIVSMTVAASGATAHSWLVKCTAVLASGDASTTSVSRRVVALRAGGGRKIVAGESTQYDATEGWVAAFNEFVDTPMTGGVVLATPDTVALRDGTGALRAVKVSNPGGASFQVSEEATASTYVVGASVAIGPSLTGRRNVIGSGLAANEARRTVYDGTNAVAITEDALAAGSSLTAAGTLDLAGTSASISETSAGEHSITVTTSGIRIESDEGARFGALGMAAGDGLGTIVDAGGIRAERRTGDNAANALAIYGGQASSGSTTGPNSVGGAVRIRGGEGEALGTDPFGDVRVSLGRAIADNSSAKLSICFATSGSDYFASELLAFSRSTAARCYIASTPAVQWQAASFWNLNSNDFVLIEAGNGSYGSFYLGTYAHLYVPSGDMRYLGPSAIPRATLDMPPKVTPAGAGATVVGTFTVGASLAGVWRGTLVVRNGAGNSKSFSIQIEWDADATTVTVQAAGKVFAVLPGNAGTVVTVVGDITCTTSGLVVSVLAANAAGYLCALTGRNDQ